MNTREISVLEPIEKAFATTSQVLFRPFDLGKWFTIGFCAFLAYLGSGGGGGTGFHGPDRRSGDLGNAVERAWEYVVANLLWIVPLALTILLLGIAIMLVMVWLSSRGKFMFLHCVALNRSEVAVPWRLYHREANSLFIFRVVAGLLFTIPILAVVLGVIGATWPLMRGGELAVLGVVLLVMIVLAAIVVGIAFWVYVRLLEDFVVPVMFQQRTDCVPAWRIVLGLARAHMVPFVLYLLMRILLALAIGVLVIALVLITCCIAGCILMIPYLGTVLLLPVLVFDRSYSLHFLAQLGPEFDVFRYSEPQVTP